MKNMIRMMVFALMTMIGMSTFAAWSITYGEFRGSENYWQSPLNPSSTYHCPTAGTISVDVMKYVLLGRNNDNNWTGVSGEFYDALNYPQDFYLNWTHGNFAGENNVFGVAWIVRVHFNNGIYGYAPQANDNKMFTLTTTPDEGAAQFEYALNPPSPGCAWADYLIKPYGGSAAQTLLINYGSIIAIPPSLNNPPLMTCPYQF